MGAIRGSRIIYLYRILKDAATSDATAVAFTTENERTKSRDADTTETKDGSIRTPGALESEITATAIFSSEGDEMIGKLEKAVDNSDKVEIWEVNLDKPGETENAGCWEICSKVFSGVCHGVWAYLECGGSCRSFSDIWSRRGWCRRVCNSI